MGEIDESAEKGEGIPPSDEYVISDKRSHSVVSSCLWPHGLYRPRHSPGQNTGVGSLFQGIFWTQGWNPGLLPCRQILYQLSYQGSPRILEWVPYSFSRGSSQPRNWTGVSCLAGRFFTSWATREAQWWILWIPRSRTGGDWDFLVAQDCANCCMCLV